MSIIPHSFYLQNTLIVARELLGKVLFRRIDSKIFRGMIVETEAYLPNDPASHSFHGRTKRTDAMFGQPGTLYIYLIYGLYHCLNIVTERENFGAAVLIRALEDLDHEHDMSGPGKICKVMNIGMDCNHRHIFSHQSDIWIENGEKVSVQNIVQTTRVGITKATEQPWRFYIRGNKSVSRTCINFGARNGTRTHTP